MRYEPVIGLEVHVQLATRTKLFAPERVHAHAEPNTNISPVTLGMPGVLPVLNRRAVTLAIRAGLALGCRVRLRSEFARKNYFYPDLPKGYQISQHTLPICEGGEVVFTNRDGAPRRCPLTRIHIEEDAGKSVHLDGRPHTHLDFNRAGVPLIEVVSEPELYSSADAADYMRALHEIVVALGVTEGSMELGQFRCDANISLRPIGAKKLGVRVEIKNLNSFKFVEAAIDFEIGRQAALLDAGQLPRQSTRLWDSHAKKTREMRKKEDAHDYRYFPDPDLPPLVIEPALIDALRAALPELPAARRRRYVEQLGLPPYDADVLTATPALAKFFDDALDHYDAPKALSNFLMGEVLRESNERGLSVSALGGLTPGRFADIVRLIDDREVTHAIAAQVLQRTIDEDRDPIILLDLHGLRVVDDRAALADAIDAVLAREHKNLERYRGGARKLFGFFMGSVMRETKGRGDPQQLKALLKKKLDGE